MLTINLDPFPEIITERLVLRRTTLADVDDILFMRSDPRVMQYIKKVPCQSREEAAAFINDKLEASIANNDGIPWAMSLRGETKLIGCIGIWRLIKEHYRGEIGYSMHPNYWGKGYMHEALGAAIQYGFHTMGLHSIEANTDPENKASQKLLERHGFEREGRQRENYFFEGKFYDTVTFGLITPLK